MSIFEYNKEEEERKLRKAEYEIGIQDGIQIGINKERINTERERQNAERERQNAEKERQNAEKERVRAIALEKELRLLKEKML